MVWFCAPSNAYVETPKLQCNGLETGSLGGNEGKMRYPHGGISTLIERDPRMLDHLLLLYAMWGHSGNVTVYKPGREPSPETEL